MAFAFSTSMSRKGRATERSTYTRLFALHFWPVVSTLVAGSLAAFLFEWRPDIAKTISYAWPLAFAITPFMLQASMSALAPGMVGQRPWDWNLSIGIAWVPVVFACAFGLRPMAVFAARPMRFLGAVSFGTYLLHPVIFSGAASAGLTGRAWAGPIVLAAVIVTAWLAHITIERPARRAADWFQQRRPLRLPALSVGEGPALSVGEGNVDARADQRDVIV